MRKTLLVLTIAASSMLAPTFLQTPAEAGVFWSIGSVFSVGGLDFALVFGLPGGPHGGYYGESYYYRTHRPLHYRGYSCHNGCSFRAGYYYHHPDCAAVHYHFGRYRFSPDRHLRSAPWYYSGSWQYDRYRRDARYYQRYRYDERRYDRHRYDRHHGDRRYDGRERYDRRGGDRHQGRGDRSYGDRGRNDHRRDGDYGRDDRRRNDRHDSSRRRGDDTRSRGRRHND